MTVRFAMIGPLLHGAIRLADTLDDEEPCQKKFTDFVAIIREMRLRLDACRLFGVPAHEHVLSDEASKLSELHGGLEAILCDFKNATLVELGNAFKAKATKSIAFVTGEFKQFIEELQSIPVEMEHVKDKHSLLEDGKPGFLFVQAWMNDAHTSWAAYSAWVSKFDVKVEDDPLLRLYGDGTKILDLLTVVQVLNRPEDVRKQQMVTLKAQVDFATLPESIRKLLQ